MNDDFLKIDLKYKKEGKKWHDGHG